MKHYIKEVICFRCKFGLESELNDKKGLICVFVLLGELEDEGRGERLLERGGKEREERGGQGRRRRVKDEETGNRTKGKLCDGKKRKEEPKKEAVRQEMI